MTRSSVFARGLCVVLVTMFSFVMNMTCTGQTIIGQSSSVTTVRSEKERLDKFMEGCTEKVINTRYVNIEDIIETAKGFLGVPHCMGGTSNQCLDCSGLLVVVFSQYGVQLPHSSEEQARYGRIISDRDDLIKGDLVFFTSSYSTNHFITHAGIYTGHNKFIHTSSSVGVTITKLDNPWWADRFVFGTRVIE